jgi:glutathione synthase/RimK-type ligase-like ATP-grasp enzyme
MKKKIVLFRNESADDHELWAEASSRRQDEIDYKVLDITASDWLERFREEQFDLVLLRPPGRTWQYKQLYDERSYILYHYSGLPVYPSLNEILIYENKRLLSDWLKVNDIPHPETWVFFSEKEALDHASSGIAFPLVAKTNIGASGNGVRFLGNEKELREYIVMAFGKGVGVRTGPKLRKGSLASKLLKALLTRGFVKKRLGEYKASYDNPQRGFVIFQQFIIHSYEWRCVRIGDSFFAHKKIARNNKSSGTLIKAYDPVPESLLTFIRDITEKTDLSSVAVDLFERDGQYLVNEVQCFFGQSDPYQMLVDSIPGRYRYLEGRWKFEAGDYASNACYDLRLEHALTRIIET